MINCIRHLGNTANNAHYNSEIWSTTVGSEVNQEVLEFGLTHAISAPAWETLEFEVPSPDWVDAPDWSEVPGAKEANQHVGHFSRTHNGLLALSVDRLGRLVRGFSFKLDRFLWRKFGFVGPSFLSGAGLKIFGRASKAGDVTIIYGANFVGSVRLPKRQKGIAVAFEHGTFRWAVSPAQNFLDRRIQKRYLREISKCDVALVTNLDPESIAATREIFNDRWVAIPHPYTPNPEAPYKTDSRVREELLKTTQSESLILLGASHNSSKFHDKGTNRALEAFKSLRERGEAVGLVTIAWGLEVEDSRRKISEWGLDSFVHWVSPLPRKNLQKLSASCDLSWNQFGYDGIGAFDLRMLEQGLPHVSSGIDQFGESLVGSRTPWYGARTPEEIVSQTQSVLKKIRELGRRAVMSDHQEKYHQWLNTYHSSDLTVQIQRQSLDLVLNQTSRNLPINPALWKIIALKGSQQ